jgi:hypothetical protein
MAATILALLGIGANLDGAPLEIVGTERPADRAFVAAPAGERVDDPVYSDEEEAAMVERLRDLGYE